MADGPWTKYQQQPAAASGPWAKYAQSAPVAAPTAPEPTDYRGEGGGRGTGLEAALIGARQGVTFGFGDEINAGVRAGMDWLGGKPIGEAYNQRLEHERGLLDQTRQENPVSSLAGEVGGAVAPALLTGGAAAPMTVGRAAASGAAGGAAYGFGEGEGGLRERAESAAVTGALGGAGGAATAKVVNALANRAATTAAAKAVPSVDDLKGQASALYKAAETSGAKAAPEQTQKLAEALANMADDANLVAPDGSIASKYTSVADALRVSIKYAGQEMTPGQMQVVRESFTEAAKQPGREGRIGTQMLREFDTFSKGVAPQLREADAVYAKAMKGSRIEQAIELARVQAGQFSGSGFENALRTQFRALERQIVKGTLKGLSDEEKKAISRVARGGAVENVARWIGKAAPTSIVSAGQGGGMASIAGTMFGGPGVGAAAGIGTMGAGLAGRKIATSLQSRNAEVAAALARSGGQLPLQPSQSAQQAIAALIAAQRGPLSRLGQ